MSTMQSARLSFTFALLVASSTLVFADSIGVEANFRVSKLEQPPWSVTFGSWVPTDGVLVGKQVKADNHAAALRWSMPLTDGTIECDVRLDGAKAVHIGFDPARGELKKKGHLYSLVLTPTSAAIMHHKDKSKADSKNVLLARADFDDRTGQWIAVRLTMEGNKVTVKLGDTVTISATHPEFGVKKPGVVFRVIGESVKIRNLNLGRPE